MKHSISALATVALSLSTLPVGAASAAKNKKQADKRPNIIFILADDQPYDLLGVTGNPIVKTPNIDALANSGVLMTNAHVTSAISTPSRTCILTGRYERNHAVNFNSGTALSAEAWERCYPNVLREAGYYTGYVGKNHTPIGEKGYDTGLMDKSFDYWYGGHCHLRFYPKKHHDIFKGAKADTQIEIISEGMMDFLNPNERNLNGAFHFMDTRPKDKPFFMNICFNLPHGAGTSTMRMLKTDPELYRTAYRDQKIPLPKHYVAKKDIKTPKLPADVWRVEERQHGYDYVDNPKDLRERMIREFQTVTGIDNLVGMLREELERQGIADNTIIIYSSDHGIFKGEFGLGGKSMCYEICTRVPLIVYDPRPEGQRLAKKLNHRDNSLALALDLGPTMLDYAGVQAPVDYQGFSLRPILEGKKDEVRDYLFTENLWSTQFGNPRCESVQNKRWKYIRYYKNETVRASARMAHLKDLGLTGKAIYQNYLPDALLYRSYVDAGLNGEKPVYEELYDLQNDPDETTNLAYKSEQKARMAEMRKVWKKELTMARGNRKVKPAVVLDFDNYLDAVKPE